MIIYNTPSSESQLRKHVYGRQEWIPKMVNSDLANL